MSERVDVRQQVLLCKLHNLRIFLTATGEQTAGDFRSFCKVFDQASRQFILTSASAFSKLPRLAVYLQ